MPKLEPTGIRGQLLEWFREYLSNRSQAVVIKGGKSCSKRAVPPGVPRGSVLGPLLFLIFINDIVNDIESVIKLVADDTGMSLALTYPDIRADILNADLHKMSDWAKRWKVKLNEEKTELLNCIRDQNQVLPLKFEGIALLDTAQHKHLGMTLQNNCKWDEHIKNITSEVNLLISCLRSNRYRLDRKALETMCKSFILPHFDYANMVWDNCTDKLSNMLESLHLGGIRTYMGATLEKSKN